MLTEIQGKSDAVTFFQDVYASFLSAEKAAGGTIEKFFSIANSIIRLRFAGSFLLPFITPALEHLAVEPVENPDLTICLCDSLSTGILMPPPAWNAAYYQACGEVQDFITDRIYTHFEVGPNALSIIDAGQRLAIYWVSYPDRLPDYEFAVPVRTILHLWMSRKKIHIVHAGSVGLPDAGVLLLGHGGAGKSNTALACLKSPLYYISDDHCLVTSDPVPTVYSIYGTGKTHAEDIERLPFLASMISNPDKLGTEKALYLINRHFPGKLLRSFPISAILILRITGKRDTTIQPASPAAGLMLVGPGQALQWPSAGRETFRTIGSIFKQTPSYYLNLGTDTEQIPALILDLLTTANGERE